MKAKFKNLLLVLCMVTCVFAFSACGKEESKTDGYAPDDYAKICAYDVVQYLINDKLSVDNAKKNEVFDSSINDEAIEAFIETFKNFKEEVGGIKYDSDSAVSTISVLYEAASSGSISEAQLLKGYVDAYETAGLKTKEINYGDYQNVVISLEGTERNATVEVSLNKKAQVVNITPAAIYTSKEKVVKAAMNTLMGMGTVFIVLILISFIIKMFGVIPVLMEKKKKKEEVPVIKEAKVAVPTPAKKAAPVVEKNLTDDSELVAVITAAILASSTCNATSADQLIVRSIKKVKRK